MPNRKISPEVRLHSLLTCVFEILKGFSAGLRDEVESSNWPKFVLYPPPSLEWGLWMRSALRVQCVIKFAGDPPERSVTARSDESDPAAADLNVSCC